MDSADQYLNQLQQEGTVHSVGRFTLSPEKLREKLSQFSFQRASQWILKVVQALVLAEVESCKIAQSHQRTEIHIKSQGSLYSSFDLEQAFCAPDSQPNNSLSNLVTALYYLSFNLHLTWAWKDQGSKTALVWNGTQLSEITSISTDYATLQVSHIQHNAEGLWWGPLLKITGYKGPEACAQITRELKLHAHTCPFPLKLDGLRIDNLLHCSTMTSTHNTSTKASDLIAARGCGRTLGAGSPLNISYRIRNSDHLDAEPTDQIPPDCTWIALLFGHLRLVVQSYGNDYAPSPNTSRITWVRHGIVVTEEKLATDCGASVHLFLSADHLKTDISGLQLIQERIKPQPETIQDIIDWLRPENHQLVLQNRFVTLGIADPEALDELLKKEISSLIRQLRPRSGIKEESITNLSQILKQIQTDLHVEPS